MHMRIMAVNKIFVSSAADVMVTKCIRIDGAYQALESILQQRHPQPILQAEAELPITKMQTEC